MATDQQGDDSNKESEDNFGLPDIEFKPLEEKPAAAPEPTPTPEASEPTRPEPAPSSSGYEPSYESPSGSSKAPIVLVLVIGLVIAIAGYLIYAFVIKPGNEQKAKQEQLAKEKAARDKAERERLEAEKAAEAERLRKEAEANAKPAVGTIETLNGRTRRYYVIVTSDIDDDLLMDYAQKLAAKGISTKVIPPFGNKNFYRLAIGDFDTFALAQAKANESKSEYGGAVWVLKY